MLPAAEIVRQLQTLSARDRGLLRKGDAYGPWSAWDGPSQSVAWLYSLSARPRQQGTLSPGQAAGVLYARNPQERAGLQRHIAVLATTWPKPQIDDLRWFIRRLDMAGITIDWAQLLTDLREWDDQDRHVAKRWITASIAGEYKR